MSSNVKEFAVLSLISMFIGLVAVVLTFQNSATEAANLGGATFIITVQAINFGLVAVLIWLAAFRRKNWARWVLLILFVIGLPFIAMTLPTRLTNSPTEAVAEVMESVLQAAALYLVFTGNAKEWFRRSAET